MRIKSSKHGRDGDLKGDVRRCLSAEGLLLLL